MSYPFNKQGAAPRPGPTIRAAGGAAQDVAQMVGDKIRPYHSSAAQELIEGPTFRQGLMAGESRLPAPVVGMAGEVAHRMIAEAPRVAAGAGLAGANVLDAVMAPGSGRAVEWANKAIGDPLMTPLGLGLAGAALSFPFSADVAYREGTALGQMGRAQERGETLMSDPFTTFVQKRAQEKTAAGGFGFGADVVGDLLKKLVSKPGSATALGEGLQNLSLGRAAGVGAVGLGIGAGLDLMQGQDSVGSGLEYQMSKRFIPLEDRIQATDTASKAFMTQAGKNMANMLDDTMRTGINAGVGAATQHNRSFNQDVQFQQAMKTDPLLRDATRQDKEMLRRSFNSMSRFSPDLATDEFAVQNFLRESLLAANGPDYATLGNMARVNEAIAPTAFFPQKAKEAI